MKKIVSTFLLSLLGSAAIALPVGNPGEASLMTDGLFWDGLSQYPYPSLMTWCDRFSLRLGFYGDYVFNRHMRVDSDEAATPHQIDEVQLFTNSGYLVLNWFDRLDLFATLGASTLFINTDAVAFNGTSGHLLQLETTPDFSWSVGSRLTVARVGCTLIGLSGQYFTTNPDVKRLTDAKDFSFYPEEADTNARYSEWQIAFGLSYRYYNCLPYIAVEWNRSNYNLRDVDIEFLDDTLYNLKNQRNWGYVLGISLIDCKIFSATIEGRFLSEKALYVNGQCRF